MKYDFTRRGKKHPSLYIIAAGVILLAFALVTGNQQQPAATTTTSTTTTIAATTTAPTTTTVPATTTTSTTTTTTIAGNQPPRVISSAQKPDPIRTGREVTFLVKVADAESEFVTVNVCKNAQCTARYCIGQGNAKPAGADIACTYVIPVTTSGAINYWAKAEQAGGVSEIAGPFILNVTSL
ncbi:MAG: hypothetical protein HY516_03600 [Candidatus Aenigmarchaeota archaeon]|nr:hypothetical protein [Candidatus Aenigmarchaeota archaeon]